MTDVARRVYIISDLHLGGRVASGGDRGFRIMTHPEALAEFVRGIAREDGRPLELVIAGDFVDFLAEDGELPGEWSPLIDNPVRAAAVVRRLIAEHRAVFDALRVFVAAGHVVTVMLGNHDIELSYPAVRRELLDALGVGPGRGIQFIHDNEAYRVGDALIEHGNRYDAFNQVDHDRLRRRRSLQSRGQHTTREDGFEAPVGSRLVAEVMNPIKARYAFVDLLKPETHTVLPLLLALEPSLRGKLSQLLRTLAPVLTRGVSRTQPDIPLQLRDAAGMDPEGIEQPSGAGDPLAAALDEALGSGGSAAFMADLECAGSAVDVAVQVSDASADSRATASGLWGLLRARKTQPIAARLPALRKALRALQHADAFQIDRESTVAYLRAAEQLCERSGVRCVIFGHSHLARDVALGGGRRYLNSGTWANLLRVPNDVMAEIHAERSETCPALATWLEKLRDNRLDTWFRPTYVRLDLSADDHLLHARMLEYTGGDPATP